MKKGNRLLAFWMQAFKAYYSWVIPSMLRSHRDLLTASRHTKVQKLPRDNGCGASFLEEGIKVSLSSHLHNQKMKMMLMEPRILKDPTIRTLSCSHATPEQEPPSLRDERRARHSVNWSHRRHHNWSSLCSHNNLSQLQKNSPWCVASSITPILIPLLMYHLQPLYQSQPLPSCPCRSSPSKMPCLCCPLWAPPSWLMNFWKMLRWLELLSALQLEINWYQIWDLQGHYSLSASLNGSSESKKAWSQGRTNCPKSSKPGVHEHTNELCKPISNMQNRQH